MDRVSVQTAAFHVGDPVVRCALGLATGADPMSWLESLGNPPGYGSGETSSPPVGSEKRGGSSVGGGEGIWDELLAVLDRLGLAPWVWSRLEGIPDSSRAGPGVSSRSGSEKRPADVMPWSFAVALAQRHLGTIAHNMILLDALDEILAGAESGGLPVLPIKGAALLGPPFRVYRDPGARPMVDLDLFCPPSHLEEFSALLRELGYRLTETALDHAGLGHHRYFSRPLAAATPVPEPMSASGAPPHEGASPSANALSGGAEAESREPGSCSSVRRTADGRSADRGRFATSVTVELHYRLSVWWWGLGALDREFTEALLLAADSPVDSAPASFRHRGRVEGSQSVSPPPGLPGPLLRGDRAGATPRRGWTERHIIQICLHLLKHGLGPDLRNVVDVLELSRVHHPDWNLLTDLARSAKIWPTISFILGWIQDTILAPVGEKAPWVDVLATLPRSEQGLSGLLASRIPRDKIPPIFVSPDLPFGLHRRIERGLEGGANHILLDLALLPTARAKVAAATWWLWDRWNLRRLLPSPRQ